MSKLAASWKDSYASMLVDIAVLLEGRMIQSQIAPRTALPSGTPTGSDSGAMPDALAGFSRQSDSPAPLPGSDPRSRVLRFLERRTGKRFGDDIRKWRRWTWSLPYDPHPEYAQFKRNLYSSIDTRMAAFFSAGTRSFIRLDEIEWGGVRVNGIPPLDHPKYIRARDADYLEDKHVVFGLVVRGEARAYPKRILAWHELARDKLGGLDLTIVYCTLCGTVVPYESVAGGRRYTFGTSGLLYRSNKLMFDEETGSLWASLDGKAVTGALAGTELSLVSHPVVTTTWGEWKGMHPQTTVLSLETGFKRDYGEGAAYRDYFSTDELMFPVPGRDDRLSNKDEVLVFPLLAKGSSETERKPLAVAVSYLKKHSILHVEQEGRSLVVLTSPGGANRAYEVSGVRIMGRLDSGRVRDNRGHIWRVSEHALVSEGATLPSLPRVPAHRSFWFAWHAQHPDTELIR